MKRLIPVISLAVLGLTGCPKTAVFSWTSTGNPQLAACGPNPCLVQYVIKDANGKVVATPAIGTLTYTMKLTTVPTATYTLTVTAKDPSGNQVSSPPATATTAQ